MLGKVRRPEEDEQCATRNRERLFTHIRNAAIGEQRIERVHKGRVRLTRLVQAQDDEGVVLGGIDTFRRVDQRDDQILIVVAQQTGRRTSECHRVALVAVLAQRDGLVLIGIACAFTHLEEGGQ